MTDDAHGTDSFNEVILAIEILAMIKEGKPVKYEGVTVEGDLDIRTLNLPKHGEKFLITSQIEITSSRINGLTYFGNSIIAESINFHSTEFSKYVDFTECQFNGCTDFNNAQFSGYDLFDRCQFNGYALFEGCRFNGMVEFAQSYFGEDADFSNSQFVEYALFNMTQFNKDALFRGSKFCGSAGFHGTLFKGVAEFADSLFKGNAGFDGSLFNKSADFSKVEFNGDAGFDASLFSNGAYFNETQFNGDATFRESKFEKGEFGFYALFNRCKFRKCAFFFESSFTAIVSFNETIFVGDAEFSRANFSGDASFEFTHFSKRLILDNSKIYNMNLLAQFDDGSTISLKHSELSKLDVSWIAIKDRIEEDISAYSALVKNYNNQERFDEADDCYFQYKLRRSRTLKLSDRIFDFLSFIAYGYGVRPGYPLMGLIVIFIASVIVYSFEGQTSFPSSFGVSAVVLTTTNQIEGFSETCKSWSIIERILGWLLMSTFLVSLSKKTLR